MNSKNLLFYSPLALGVAIGMNSGAAFANSSVTPIQHLIVVVGENVTFDTLYGAYQPPKGQSVKNLLSQGIITANGQPGPYYFTAAQRKGINSNGQYSVTPTPGAAFSALPQPLETGIVDLYTLQTFSGNPDLRFPSNMLPGPFQITKYVPYGSTSSLSGSSSTGDPVHRFFQMWQQTSGSNQNHSLFTWVATTVGTGGDNGATGPAPGLPLQGGELMGYFNMAQGDAPYFNQLAQQYALSDNYHQSLMGGTGANFFAIATGDVAVYNNAGILTPPANQIENPNPQAGTDNFYTQDGYSGGSYVNCSDSSQPGVAAILSVLQTKSIDSRCANGAYYLVNNYTPPYTVTGKVNALTPTNYVYPPQTIPTIGEALSASAVSWKWYTSGRDTNDILNDSLYPEIRYVVNSQVPSTIPEPTRTQIVNSTTFSTAQSAIYNSIGDPLNASSNVVNTPALYQNLAGYQTFTNDVTNGTLPAVSFVVPKNLVSGHPGYSAPVNYEKFLQNLIAQVQASPAWANTAIIITTDEGGGYFDTGAIQSVDFFGDGTRIPLLVVSPYAKKGYVDHVYHDHASILKFIEYNWGLNPLSSRSRDNLPNPVAGVNTYLPSNQPAIGDLTSLFSFPAK
jgi:phospholipase C